MQIADEQIKKDIVNQLYWDARVDASDVNVEVSGGVVILYGTVSTSMARRAAESDAWTVPGTNSVSNQIAVAPMEENEAPSDREVETAVKAVLGAHSSIDSSELNASVVGGMVGLEGKVDEYWKTLLAEELACGVRGVAGVTNKLTVVPKDSFMDRTVAEDIVAAMERNASVNPEHVTVRVEDGAVTLSGTVPHRDAYRAAQEAAMYTLGVMHVKNYLTIGIPETLDGCADRQSGEQ
jgi:osmotically-inducible protein OsmY